MAKRKLADREKKFLKLLDAYPSINSGATFSDNDGMIQYPYGKISVEVKCTDAKSFSLKKEIWDKTDKEARRINATPIMGIDIQGKRLIVIDANDFLEMLWIMSNDD